MMSVNAELKARSVGMGEVDHVAGSRRCGRSKGSEERAGSESMRDDTKAMGARVTASGRPIPPADAERVHWKAVRLGVSVRRRWG